MRLRAGAHSALAIPLQHSGIVLGAVCLVRDALDQPFLPDEIDGLVAFLGIGSGVLLGQARVRLSDATPVFNELQREITLVLGYLELLACDPCPLPAPREWAGHALRAGWRAAWHVTRLRRGDHPEGASGTQHTTAGRPIIAAAQP